MNAAWTRPFVSLTLLITIQGIAFITACPTEESVDKPVLLRQSNEPFNYFLFCMPKQLIVAGGSTNAIRSWDIRTGLARSEIKTTYGGHSSDLSTSFDGSLVAGVYSTNNLGLWDLPSGKLIKVFTCPKDDTVIIVSAISRNGKLVASGNGDDTASVWNVESGKCKAMIGHSSSVLAVGFSMDSKRLATGSRDGSIRIWNTETAAEMKHFAICAGRVMSASFADSDKAILGYSYEQNSTSISDPPAIFVLNVEDGKILARFRGWQCPVASKDGKFISAISKDSDAVAVWNTRSYKQVSLYSAAKQKIIVGIAFDDTNRLEIAESGAEGCYVLTLDRKF